MKSVIKNNISKELLDSPLYLYGAGYTGKLCMNALQQVDIKIDAFVDDDVLKHGTSIRMLPVISYDDLVDECKKTEKINVILTSIYGKSIYNRLQRISNVTVWEMYGWIEDLLGQKDIVVERKCSDEQLEQYKKNTDMLKNYLEDSESQMVFDAVYKYFKMKNMDCLIDICTTEECYFIKEVREYFENKNAFSLVDAGAYEGELLRVIVDLNLKVKEWYCFEVEKSNYERLRHSVCRNKIPEGMSFICKNCGLWSERKELFVTDQGAISKVLEIPLDNGQQVCSMETIDDYFENIKVDMIKMDIEGAEMEALKGGIRTIQRDKPVLAISIYHYIQDYYRILQFLINQTSGYKYYIRHHALIYGETVLYAIPSKEKTSNNMCI